MRVIDCKGGCIPDANQRLLIRACVAPPEEALEAWGAWNKVASLDVVDEALYRLLPVLYRNLQRAGYDGPEMPTLKGVHRRSWYCNQKTFHAMEGVIGLFDERSIPSLLVKGAALGQLYYPDPSARSMSDGDLMVPFSRAAEAHDLLTANGWKIICGMRSDLHQRHHAMTYKRGEGEALDLHWNLIPECVGEGASDGFWARAVPMLFRTRSVQTLSATDHFFHTCVHGYLWNILPPLRWVVDCLLILEKESETIEWNVIIAESKRLHVSYRVRRAIEFLAEHCAAPIPHTVLAELRGLEVSAEERNEHDVLTQIGEKQSWLHVHFLRPVRKLWYVQHRYEPGRPALLRVLTYPAILRDAMFLSHVWQVPLYVLRYSAAIFTRSLVR